MRWMIALLMVALLAGCTQEETDDTEGTVVVEDGPEVELAAKPLYYNLTGTITALTPEGNSVVDGDVPFDIHVPFGTARVDATVTWSDPAANLVVVLPESLGGSQGAVSEDGRYSTYNNAPKEGNHSIVVRSDLAANVAFDLLVVVSPDQAITSLLSETVTVAPQAIFEINLENDLHDNMSWVWSASAVNEFNIHTHFDGEVQYLVFETTDEHSGSYQVNRTGGHSFMWENTGTTPITIEYRIWGAFQVHSYFPPR